MKGLRALSLDLVLFGSFVLVGVVAVLVAAASCAGEPDLVRQLPYVVSGGVGGLLLIVTGSYLAAVQLNRRVEARKRRQVQQVLEQAQGLLTDLRSRTPISSRTRRAPKPG